VAQGCRFSLPLLFPAPILTDCLFYLPAAPVEKFRGWMILLLVAGFIPARPVFRPSLSQSNEFLQAEMGIFFP